jgi:formylglycine-generating enzyme required for sulfatase activity/tRNA A-37 threonylcarbamoyl transferase component Bud32
MGVVHRVRDRRLGREVALKLIRPDKSSDLAARRFRREARVTARLEHPAIPAVLEAGTTARGEPFLLMRVIEGSTLRERIAALHADPPDPAELRELLEVLVKVGDAVAYAHEKKVVHRDLKPDNVMIGAFGEVLVLDWGLARALDMDERDDEELLRSTAVSESDRQAATSQGLTVPGTIMGTLCYASPEQVRGEPVDSRADVFALGSILTEVLTGDPALTGEDLLTLVCATQAGEVVLPRERRGDVPAELNSIAARALAAEPAARYPTAEPLVADLRAYLAGERVVAHTYLLRERLQRWPSRHPRAVLGALAGLVLLVVATLLVGWSQAERARGRAEESEETARRERDRAELAYARNRGYTDRGLLQLQRRAAEALWPAAPRQIEALEAWLASVRRGPLAHLDEHRQRLAEHLRRPSRSAEEQVEVDALEAVLADLEALATPEPLDPWGPTLTGIERRLDFARSVRARSLESEEAREAWAAACAEVGRSPVYAGLTLEPVEGLLPLGPDPASGLYEFWHLQSGDCPQRGPDGRIVPEEGAGIVLVLIPGGRFTMGSETRRTERPRHEVVVPPFFLGKYELTQAQYVRTMGVNPSGFSPAKRPPYRVTLLHPVETVSWHGGQRVATRLDLRLPSEAEWEYAARAGTTAPWWTGVSPDSVQGAANVCDVSYLRSGGHGDAVSWDDGYGPHAPVGSFAANPFGLHDTIGNVWEWVQDGLPSREFPGYEGAPHDGSAVEVEGAAFRVFRGGAFSVILENCRSATRGVAAPDEDNWHCGLRVARSLPRPGPR